MSLLVIDPREDYFSSVEEAIDSLKKLGRDLGFNTRFHYLHR
jgi:hypothetical protein